ncbi:UV-endonuclease UvdE-domain-containing protein [Multifurca ochricompacta]|uniref:UV-endonuclease UvdE-domain-containing protein n=1 Tax=Multifurca ochricompacta TaxID=376703 RepID=A0AAD4M7X5_9AGAM|nr:UV-endonuclease UvdE-domain-containing protein [Multifurca ochricompacta]
MGIGKDGVIIIHAGGVYGDKATTLTRFKANYRALLSDEIKARLVVENDEELDLPLVFDYHHDWIYPSSEPCITLIPRINAIWHRKGIKPKQHLSSPRQSAVTVMEKRAHARRCNTLPAELEAEGAGWWWRTPGEREWVDLMIEAKDKEQAVFQLYRIYGLGHVIRENLRPEQTDQVQSTHKGRASARRARKAKNSGKDDEDPLERLVVIDPKTAAGAEAPPTAGDQGLKPQRGGCKRRPARVKAKGKVAD